MSSAGELGTSGRGLTLSVRSLTPTSGGTSSALPERLRTWNLSGPCSRPQLWRRLLRVVTGSSSVPVQRPLSRIPPPPKTSIHICMITEKPTIALFIWAFGGAIFVLNNPEMRYWAIRCHIFSNVFPPVLGINSQTQKFAFLDKIWHNSLISPVLFIAEKCSLLLPDFLGNSWSTSWTLVSIKIISLARTTPSTRYV